jgi:hypothetical protein
VDGGGKSSPGDNRNLNFRVFEVGCAEDLARTPPTLLALNGESDIESAAYRQALVSGEIPADAVLLGHGWYDAEGQPSERFRWASNDAELVVTAPFGTERQIQLEVEPGPGLGSQPFTMEILDWEGKQVAAIPVQGRETVGATLPTHPGTDSVFRLHVSGGGLLTPNDPRTLNFRVFSLR